LPRRLARGLRHLRERQALIITCHCSPAPGVAHTVIFALALGESLRTQHQKQAHCRKYQSISRALHNSPPASTYFLACPLRVKHAAHTEVPAVTWRQCQAEVTDVSYPSA